MKMFIRSLFVTAIAGLAAVSVQAAEVASEVIVNKLSGSAQAVLPGQSAPVALKEGDKLPQGTSVTTDGTSEVELQVFPGTTATLKPGTTAELEKLALTSASGVVTKQSSVINLKVGTVVSNLDPEKKSINDYSVRTPKGVAAARGTVYQVIVLTDGSTVTEVLRGTVTFFNPTTGQSVTVKAGYKVKIDAQGNIGKPFAVNLSSGIKGDIVSISLNKNDDIDTTIVVSPSQ